MMPIVNGPGWGPMHGYGYANGWMRLWGPIMMIFWIAVLGVVAWPMVRAMNGRRPVPSAPDGADRAREILAERYARGEINTEEYAERLNRLTATGTPGTPGGPAS